MNHLRLDPRRNRRQWRHTRKQLESARCGVAAARVPSPASRRPDGPDSGDSRLEGAAQLVVALAATAVLILSGARLTRSAEHLWRPVGVAVQAHSGMPAAAAGTLSVPSVSGPEQCPLAAGPVLPAPPPPTSRPTGRPI